MIEAEVIGDFFYKHGFGPYLGVPCSILSPLINYIIEHPGIEYYGSTSEGEAIGIAAGFTLAGRKPVVLMQNSGLGNGINPLTSLHLIYKMPILLLITLRGEAGFSDEPQHRIMGAITFDLLKDMGIPFEVMEDDKEKLIDQLENINKKSKFNSNPMALVIRKGTISSYQLKDYKKASDKYLLSRKNAIQIILSCIADDDAVISTTGKISRELFFENETREGNFYMVGSMGCASAIAFGLAMEKPKKRTIVLDGDGAFLMKMGNTATIGYYKPANFIYIVLDNESHDSTGGQFTVSSKINFGGIASSCGFKNTVKVSTEPELRKELKKIVLGEGPHFIHVKVLKGADKKLGRPTLNPTQNKNQFSAFIRK